MSKLFKIIIKPVFKNKDGQIYFIRNENSKLVLPELEMDFNYKNIDEFISQKLQSKEVQYKITRSQISKRELFGELNYFIEITSEKSNVSKLFTGGDFYDLDNEDVDVDTRENFK